ncbi:MAG: type III pantothenate kinase [Parachlamydiales bacterium]|nr:type III pantothenate kinase [Parachlamydiales bacterium]
MNFPEQPILLVIDIGNSYMVGAHYHNDKCLKKWRIRTTDDWSKLIIQYLDETISSACIGSVDTKHDELLSRVLKAKGINAVHFLNPLESTIKLNIDDPKEMPADRLANVYGGRFLQPNSHLIIIDIGTAVTFDVMTKDHVFLGGAITPGLEMSAKALHEHTDLLPLIPIKRPPSELGKNTETNVQSGIYYSLVGGAGYLISHYNQNCFKSDPSLVIATGGALDPNHSLIAKDLSEDLKRQGVHFIEPDLTLIGLREILKEKNQI